VHRPDVIFLPGDVAIKRVYTDVQDLGIKRGELLAVAIERRQLLRSSRSPVQGMEADDHIFLSPKITQPDSDTLLSFDGGEIKVWGHVSNFQRHNFSCQGILQFWADAWRWRLAARS
jgi:hypothetical protein